MKTLFENKNTSASDDKIESQTLFSPTLANERAQASPKKISATNNVEQSGSTISANSAQVLKENVWGFQSEKKLPNVQKEMAEFARQETLMKTAGIVQRNLPIVAGAEDAKGGVSKKTDTAIISERPNQQSNGASAKKGMSGKKILWLALMLLFALAFIVAAVNLWLTMRGRQENEGLNLVDKREIIEYWGVTEDTKAVEAALERFEGQSGVSVNYVKQNESDYFERLYEAIEAGNGPDVFQWNLAWGELLDKQLVRMTEAEILGERKFSDVFYPVMTEELVDEEGQVRGVPLSYDGLVMFYNKDMLAAAQVEVPKLWSELLITGRKMTRKNAEGQIEQAGVAMGLGDNIGEATSIAGLLAEQNNVDLKFMDRADVINIDNMTAVLKFYSDFYNDEVNRTWDEALGEDVEAFGAGKVGIIFGKASLWNELNSKYVGLNIGVAATPILTSEANENMATIWAAGVNEKGNKKAAAKKLAAFLASVEAEDTLWTAQLKNGAKVGSVFARRDLRDTIISEEVARISLLGAEQGRTNLLDAMAISAQSVGEVQEVYKEVMTQLTLGVGGNAERKIEPKAGVDTVMRAMDTYNRELKAADV